MRGDKLISLIATLNKKEKQELLKFSKVDYHNNNERVSHCLEFLCQSGLNQEIEDKALFKELFPEEKTPNNEKLRDLLYFATKVFNNFIIFQQSSQNKQFNDQIYNEFLRSKGQYKLLDQRLKKEIKQIHAKDFLNIEDHKSLFDLNKTRYLIHEKDNLKNGVELPIAQLDTYYFAEKLKWSMEFLGSELVTSHEYDYSFLDQVLTQVNQAPYKENKFISVYYLITLFYKKNISKKNYLALKEAIINIMPHISDQEKRSLVVDLHNYAIKLHSLTGNIEEIHEIHKINVLAIANKAFLKNGKFRSHSALNVANVALRLEKTDWVLSFIDKIRAVIDDSNSLQLIEAMTAFQLKRYDQVRDLLLGVEYKDVYLAIIAKSFVAKTYFMQKDYALLEPQLKAMEQFYRRNKIISDSLRDSNLNFVLTLKKIMKHVTSPSRLTNICEDLEGVSNMAYKAWVHSTVKELLT